METGTKLTIGTFVLVGLILSGVYFITPESKAYICEDNNLVGICEKLSKTNEQGIQTRCYFEDTYKICKSGWKEYEYFNEPQAPLEVEVYANREIYKCEVLDKRIWSYTSCISETGKQAYLGELV